MTLTGEARLAEDARIQDLIAAPHRFVAERETAARVFSCVEPLRRKQPDD